MTAHDATAPTADSAVDVARVWEIITAIDIGMLVTYLTKGLRGRPMSMVPKAKTGRIYILTEGDSSAPEDIEVTRDIFLSNQGSGDNVAINGTAHVDKNPDLVKALWNPGAQLFWPKGPEVHDVVTLIVDPAHADVWDGHNPPRGIVSRVRSIFSGESPDLGARGEVQL